MKSIHWKISTLFALLVALCATSFVTSTPAVAAPAQPDVQKVTSTFVCSTMALAFTREEAVNSSVLKCKASLINSHMAYSAALAAANPNSTVLTDCHEDPNALVTDVFYSPESLMYTAFTTGTQVCDFYIS